MITEEELARLGVPAELLEPIPLDRPQAIMNEHDLGFRHGLIESRLRRISSAKEYLKSEGGASEAIEWLVEEYAALLAEQDRIDEIGKTPYAERLDAYNVAMGLLPAESNAGSDSDSSRDYLIDEAVTKSLSSVRRELKSKGVVASSPGFDAKAREVAGWIAAHHVPMTPPSVPNRERLAIVIDRIVERLRSESDPETAPLDMVEPSPEEVAGAEKDIDTFLADVEAMPTIAPRGAEDLAANAEIERLSREIVAEEKSKAKRGKPLELMTAAELSQRQRDLSAERDRLAGLIQTNRTEDELDENRWLHASANAELAAVARLRKIPLSKRTREYEGDQAAASRIRAGEAATAPAEVIHFPEPSEAKPKKKTRTAELEKRRLAKLTPEERSKANKIGGRARMAKLTPKQRTELARKGHEASCPAPAPAPSVVADCIEGYRGAVCGTLITPQGQERACYAVVPIASLITSHNPETWQEDPHYPMMMQERDYKKDQNEQAKVGRIAKAPNPELLLSNDPTPVNGPPVVTGSGIVVGGNGRTMGLKLAYSMNTADPYVMELKARAPMFGLTAETVDGVDRPILVRVVRGLDAASQAELADASSRMNESLTGSLDEKAKGVSDSRRLSPETLLRIAEAIERHETLRRAMAEEGRTLVTALRSDGVITAQNASAMVNSAGGLTEAGKMRLEGAFLGLAAGTPDRLSQASASTVQKLERLVPYLAAVKAVNPAADMIPTFQAALDLLYQAESANMTIDEFLAQGGLFDAPAPAAPIAPPVETPASEEASPSIGAETALEVVPAALDPSLSPTSDWDPEAFSKIIANSPAAIRVFDLERLFEEASTRHRPRLAEWLVEVRPDLKNLVGEIMANIGAADAFFDARATYTVQGLSDGDQTFPVLTKQEFIAKVEPLGFKHRGQILTAGLKPELYGQPTFEGLAGPTWGNGGPLYEVSAAVEVAEAPKYEGVITQAEAIKRIKAGLKQRSTTAWSVKGERGSSFIEISAPPKRLVHGDMTTADQVELEQLLGLKRNRAHNMGITVGPDSYAFYVDRAWGRTPKPE